MPDHKVLSAHYDEEWCVTCSCGEEFWRRYRPDAEEDQRAHMREMGLAEVRAIVEPHTTRGESDGA